MALLFLEYLLLIDLQGFGVIFVLLAVREHWNSTGPIPSKYPVLARNKFLYLIWTCMSTALHFLFSSVQHIVRLLWLESKAQIKQNIECSVRCGHGACILTGST